MNNFISPAFLSTKGKKVESATITIVENGLRGETYNDGTFTIETLPYEYLCSKCGSHFYYDDFLRDMISKKETFGKKTDRCRGQEWEGRNCVHLFTITANLTYKVELVTD